MACLRIGAAAGGLATLGALAHTPASAAANRCVASHLLHAHQFAARLPALRGRRDARLTARSSGAGGSHDRPGSGSRMRGTQT